jgi:hypothetical protein
VLIRTALKRQLPGDLHNEGYPTPRLQLNTQDLADGTESQTTEFSWVQDILPVANAEPRLPCSPLSHRHECELTAANFAPPIHSPK